MHIRLCWTVSLLRPFISFTEGTLTLFAEWPFISFTEGTLTLFAEWPFTSFTERPFALLTEGSFISFTERPFALLTEGSFISFTERPFASLTEGSLSLSAVGGLSTQWSLSAAVSQAQPVLSWSLSLSAPPVRSLRALARSLNVVVSQRSGL